MRRCRTLAMLYVGSLCWLASAPGSAQTPTTAGSVQGSLVTLINSGLYSFNALERISAVDNQRSYNAVTADPRAAIYCDPQQSAASAQCPSNVFLVFRNLRSLVQNANALLGNGQPTLYSLNLSYAGLGNVLRWTAAEELLAPGSVATQFGNSQLASIAGRIAALRYGASGFSVAGVSMLPTDGVALADTSPSVLGGGASADSFDLGGAPRWGGFLNGSFGWGNRDPSVVEDAFNYDSRDLTLGVDYRISRRLVLGGALGYSHQKIDFNSTESVTGGGIRSNNYSLQVYGAYEWDGPYASLALGAARGHYASTRLITYPSENIAIPSPNATASGTTNSTAFNSTFELGWSFSHAAFAFEPYVNGNYEHIHLNGFRESSVNNIGPSAGSPAGFDFDYQAQRISVLEMTAGARLRYIISSRFGVAVPFLRAEYHHLFDDSPGTVVSAYNAISSTGADFNIPSQDPSPNFFEFVVGTSVSFGHGVQAFAQYQQSVGITDVSTHLVSVGLRGQF